MADKVRFINKLLHAFYSMRRQKAAMGRLSILITWALMFTLISLFSYLCERLP